MEKTANTNKTNMSNNQSNANNGGITLEQLLDAIFGEPTADEKYRIVLHKNTKKFMAFTKDIIDGIPAEVKPMVDPVISLAAPDIVDKMNLVANAVKDFAEIVKVEAWQVIAVLLDEPANEKEAQQVKETKDRISYVLALSTAEFASKLINDAASELDKKIKESTTESEKPREKGGNAPTIKEREKIIAEAVDEFMNFMEQVLPGEPGK